MQSLFVTSQIGFKNTVLTQSNQQVSTNARVSHPQIGQTNMQMSSIPQSSNIAQGNIQIPSLNKVGLSAPIFKNQFTALSSRMAAPKPPTMTIGSQSNSNFSSNMQNNRFQSSTQIPARSSVVMKGTFMYGAAANHMARTAANSSVVMKATAAPADTKQVIQKPLPYPINGLEPVISQNLMEYHYGKHHATYVANLNALYEKSNTALAANDHQTFVDSAQAIKFNGGGHLNHEFFWENLAPIGSGGGELPAADSAFSKALCGAFGSVDEFIAHFSANTGAVQGSGWGWLAYNKTTKDLEFRTTANQDRLSDQGAHLVPLLTIDIWEHAYYIDYQNVRPNFMKEIWKIVNWAKVVERFDAASA